MYDCVNYNLQMHVRDVPPIPPPSPKHWKKTQKQIKVKGNNTLIFQYEQQNIENHYVFLGVILWMLNVPGGSKNKNEQDDSG